MSLRDRMNAEVMNEAKNTREYRADRLVERWSRMPGIGKGINKMSEKKARNLAILLENESNYLSRFNEAQFASAFDGNKPENLLKLVRIVYPNSIRGELFYEMALESANDSVKYIEPIYEGEANPQPIYEQIADKTQDAITVTLETATTTHSWEGDFVGYDATGKIVAIRMGENYVIGEGATVASYVKKGADIHFDATKRDEVGLGEVELRVRSYRFEPKALTLGVTWTMLSEIILDGSFGVSAEELLMDSASQEIKKALDYQSIALGWACKDTEGAVTFDAMNATTAETGDWALSNGETFYQRAQVVGMAINGVKNAIYNELKRGGISGIVGSPDAIEYLKLNKAFEAKGAQTECGAYKAGEFNGIPLFVAPKALFDNGDNLLTTWTNESAGADTAIAIGTYLPLYSTGAIARKGIYKEAGMARFEDEVVMENRYLRTVALKNLLF